MLKSFLSQGHSPYQAVELAITKLKDAGFKEINLENIKKLSEGDYYVRVYDTALFALRIPRRDGKMPIRIGTGHTDFPCFKLKPAADMASSAGMCRINVEPYGGMLKRTWFDRPLGISGAIWVKSEDPFKPDMKLVDIDKPLCMIPSLAPHMDREIEGKKIDTQKELMPVTGLENQDNTQILQAVASYAGCSSEDILSFDLNLFLCQEHIEAGINGELIMSQAIDNMAAVAALTEAFVKGEKAADHIQMICLFDNEEIGSRTKQGGDSIFLKMVLDDLDIDYKNSMLLSVDGAHGVHPNYPEKADITSTVKIGQGIAIKTSASQRYATDGRLIAILKGVCDKEKISYQVQANRSGAPGGSTLGPVVSAYVPVPAVDIGIPMLAMHSACEMAALSDYRELTRALMAVL